MNFIQEKKQIMKKKRKYIDVIDNDNELNKFWDSIMLSKKSKKIKKDNLFHR